MVGKQNFSKTTAAGSGRCSCFWYISADFADPKKRVQKQYKSGTKFGRVSHGVHAKSKPAGERSWLWFCISRRNNTRRTCAYAGVCVYSILEQSSCTVGRCTNQAQPWSIAHPKYQPSETSEAVYGSALKNGARAFSTSAAVRYTVIFTDCPQFLSRRFANSSMCWQRYK